MDTQAKLRCLAGSGMFAHEASVLIQGEAQHYESMVDRELVHATGVEIGTGTEEVSALLDVTVVKVNGTAMLVELPRQVVSGGRRIWVPKAEVQL